MAVVLPIMLLLVIQVVILAVLFLALKPLGFVIDRAGRSISGLDDTEEDGGVPGGRQSPGRTYKVLMEVSVGLVVFMACLNTFRISLMYLTASITSILRMEAMPVSVPALTIMSYVLSALTGLAMAFFVHVKLRA